MITLQEAVGLFLSARADLSALTLSWYERQLRFFVDWLPPDQDWLDYKTLVKFFADEQAKVKDGVLKPKTVDAKYRALRALYNYLVGVEEIKKSPLARVKRPKVTSAEPSYIRFSEYNQLLDSIAAASWLDYRDRLILSMLFWCGLRVSELVSLQTADVDLQNEIALVRSGKGGDGRYALLLPDVTSAYTDYLAVRPKHAALFLSHHGIPLTGSGVAQMLRRRCAAAGLRRLHPHAFRHGIAMHLLNDCGADMALIQAVLGHKDLHTTQKFYARWKTKSLLEQYKKKTGQSFNKE